MTLAASPVAPAINLRPSQPSPTILVVEDDSAVQRVLVLWLHSLGYQTLTASNGCEALEVAFQHRGDIDLIVSDVIMPAMGGRRFAETLRQRGNDCPLLFVSGYCADALCDLGIIAPHAEILQKPCSFTDFAATVRRLLSAAVFAAA